MKIYITLDLTITLLVGFCLTLAGRYYGIMWPAAVGSIMLLVFRGISNNMILTICEENPEAFKDGRFFQKNYRLELGAQLAIVAFWSVLGLVAWRWFFALSTFHLCWFAGLILETLTRLWFTHTNPLKDEEE